MENQRPEEEPKRKGIFIFHQSRLELDTLTDEEYGRMIRALDDHAFNGTNPQFENRFLEMAFNILKNRDDYDEARYREIVEKRRAAGKKGAEARWNKAV